MYEIRDLTKEYILTYLTQEEIFEYFLGIPVVIGEYFRSPLRKDENPTCNFAYHRGTLFYRDWATTKPMDCFEVVKYLYNCNFYDALGIIEREMIKGSKEPLKPIKRDHKPVHHERKSTINVKFSNWQKPVIEYLKSYSITLEQCNKFNIRPIDRVWVNGNLGWVYSDHDPAVGYYFGIDEKGIEKWKIYFFKRKRAYRFITNTNRINGWIQIPKTGDHLIITKSLKDVVCLDTFGIPAIAMQSETTIPYDYIIEDLQNRFFNIYSFYDYDRTGVSNANKLRKLYGIKPIFLTNGRFNTIDYKAKDFSDYLRDNGLYKTQKLIDNYVESHLELF